MIKQPILTTFIAALFFIIILWGLHFNDPHFLFMRDIEYFLFIASASAVIAASALLNSKFSRMLLIAGSLLVAATVSLMELNAYNLKETILTNDGDRYSAINSRLIIGFSNKEEIKTLAANNIAGIFLTKRNVVNETSESITSFLAELQGIRKKHGLAPLIVATDQEGGPVSRMSPIVPRQEALSVAHSNGESSYEYGKKQGEWLRDLGVTVNFSPVVDLKPNLPPSKLDFHSLIATRAISSDPLEVIDAALPYVKGLEDSGVTATLKHFPGLARVQTDTHHFSATLDIGIDELASEDWLPFTEILKSSNSWLMLSHLILKEVDPDNPVSTSNLVVGGLIRSTLGINSTLVTDDMTMGATYNRGFCKSIAQAFSTDIDYILIAYDYEKYFTAVGCIDSHNKQQD